VQEKEYVCFFDSRIELESDDDGRIDTSLPQSKTISKCGYILPLSSMIARSKYLKYYPAM
jgi:hypothetical protein